MNEIKKYSDLEIAEILKKNADIILSLTNELAESKIQLETWERVSNSDDWMEMSSVAKLLNYKGYGRNKIFDFLRFNDILRSNNEPYQQYVERGYFKQIEQEVVLPNGDTMINRKTVISQKGIDYIRKILDRQDNGSNTEKQN